MEIKNNKISINKDYEAGFFAGYEYAGGNGKVFDIAGYDNGYMNGYLNGINVTRTELSLDEIIDEAVDRLSSNSRVDLSIFYDEEFYFAYNEGYCKAFEEIEKNIQSSIDEKIMQEDYYPIIFSTIEKCVEEIKDNRMELNAEKIVNRFMILFALNFSMKNYLKAKKITDEMSNEKLKTQIEKRLF